MHILIDLSGHTAHNRLPVFAWKPAPVQISWLGYFATTGVGEIDYVLVDQIGVPEHAHAEFTESVRYLPDTRLCFSTPQTELPVTPLPAVENGFITFGCFQNMSKVNDEVIGVWARILAALPTAHLRCQCKQLGDPGVADRLMASLARHGIQQHRIALHGAVERNAYLAAHGAVDMVLDTFPYPGGTTTCEALWMGVPTLTLCGDTLLSRQGASLLHAAGLDDWITHGKDEYARKAIGLAKDVAALKDLRVVLRQRVRVSPLFDAVRFARNFEQCLHRLWHEKQGVASA